MYFGDLIGNFSVATSVTAILVVLVLGVLNVRNKYSSGKDAETIRSLKNSLEAYETQAKADGLRLKAKETELSGLYEQNKLLVQKAEILEKHVTQAPQINDLAVQLATQHKELMIAFGRQSDNIGKMAKELGNVAKAVVKGAQDAA